VSWFGNVDVPIFTCPKLFITLDGEGWMMAYNKQDLARGLKQKFRQKKKNRESQIYLFPEFDYEPLKSKRAAEMVDTLFDIIKKALQKGDYVLIRGFGRFQVKFRWARKGRNPKTGEKIFINSSRTVIFKCSKKFKERLNP
jgi:nucleoid DNA-binding protein